MNYVNIFQQGQMILQLEPSMVLYGSFLHQASLLLRKLYKKVKMFHLILLLVQRSTPGQQAPAYTPPVCHKPPYETRHIKVKIYVQDDVWKNMTENWGQTLRI